MKPALIARTDRLRDQIAAMPMLRPAAVPSLLKGLGWLARLRLAGIPGLRGVAGLEALGQDRVEVVRIRCGKRVVEVSCDLLVVHDGIVPATDLAHAAGLQLEWDARNLAWQATTGADGQAVVVEGPALSEGPCRIRISGDAWRIGGAEVAIAHCRHAAAAILGELADTAATGDAASTLPAVRRSLAARPFLDAGFPPGLAAALPDNGTAVCRCEEITAGTLRDRIRAGVSERFDQFITRFNQG